MQNSAILIDSACAPTRELLSRHGVYQMGMKINLDGKTYTDGQDLDLEHYYGTIDKVNDFSTTPPLVWDIKKTYEEIKRKGHSSVISIHVSSKMSKVFQTCENARNMISGLDIHLVDTQNISVGAHFVAEKIIELIHNGKSYEEIKPLLPEIQKSSFLQISLSTLKYLIKNGRVGRVQGMIGSMLKMKPILGLDSEGYLTTLSKVRGGDRVIKQIAESAIEFIDRRPHNVKVYLTWGFDENKMHVERTFNLFMKDFKKLGIKNYTLHKSRMLPTIACNSGPGAYGFGVYGEEQPIE